MKLVEMNNDDFSLFLKATKLSEATQRSTSLGLPIELMTPKVEEELNKILPDGQNTQDHFFRKLVDERDEMLGYLWFGIRKNIEKRRIFIFDIHTFANHRNKGCGKFMLNWLTLETKKMGFEEIGLHVLAHNNEAMNLYAAMGFEVTNFYMAKRV